MAFKLYYEAHLSDYLLKLLENLLEVEIANGQTVPYLEYNAVVKMKMQFLSDVGKICTNCVYAVEIERGVVRFTLMPVLWG